MVVFSLQRQRAGAGPTVSPGLDTRGVGVLGAAAPGAVDSSPSPGLRGGTAGRRSASPYSSSPVVTTPEQLQRYLVSCSYESLSPLTASTELHISCGYIQRLDRLRRSVCLSPVWTHAMALSHSTIRRWVPNRLPKVARVASCVVAAGW